MTNDSMTPPLGLKYWFKRAVSLLNREPQTTSELLTLLKDMEAHHVIKSETLIMMERIALLSETKVADVMVPRDDMVTINDDAHFESVLAIINESGHSRFPVLHKKGKEIRGILLAKDLLRYVPEDKHKSFSVPLILRKASFIGENKPLDVLLRDFRKTRNHLAVVVDQYSAIAGLVTLEDVLEQIVGNIHDEHDSE